VIVEALVDLAFGLVEAVTGFLPPVELDLGGVADAFALALTFDGVAPVSEGLAAASLLLAVTGLMFAWRVIRTLVSHIPMFGGSG
jgi:hypothetical protein